MPFKTQNSKKNNKLLLRYKRLKKKLQKPQSLKGEKKERKVFLYFLLLIYIKIN